MSERPPSNQATDFDVLIVGAGISGIGMAARLKMMCPDRRFSMVEQREDLGGTWDLFRYPGIRSDSDMHSLSYNFEPWTGKETLAAGARIKDYLRGVVDKYGVMDHIQFGTKVLAAGFDSDQGRWTVKVEDEHGIRSIKVRFLYLASGYYDYDSPHSPVFKDEESFPGQVIHPQHWPERLDYSGQRVAVIGSGATAITIVPNMAKDAAKVTMIQRTPTYIRSIPGEDKIGQFLRKVLPLTFATRIARSMRVRLTHLMFKKARENPEKVRAQIERDNRKHLGELYRAEDFSPPYKPWDQRMCFVPDADLFEAMKAGKAEIVNGQIERFTSRGILMEDGRTVEADIIVKATGLTLSMGGNAELSVDGEALDPTNHFFYKSAMLSGIPNMVFPVAYTNAGSTLRFDLLSDYACRVLNKMAELDADIAVPTIPEDAELDVVQSFDLQASYIERSGNLLPKSSTSDPWRLSHNYLHDRKYMAEDPIDDGLLLFRKARDTMTNADELEAAE